MFVKGQFYSSSEKQKKKPPGVELFILVVVWWLQKSSQIHLGVWAAVIMEIPPMIENIKDNMIIEKMSYNFTYFL